MPNRSSKAKRPTDLNQLAKHVVDLATGAAGDPPLEDPTPQPAKNPAAVALGRLGGQKGGKARAEKLSADRRSEISRAAAQKRWQKPEEPEADSQA